MEKNGRIYVSNNVTNRDLMCFDLKKRHGIRPDLKKQSNSFEIGFKGDI